MHFLSLRRRTLTADELRVSADDLQDEEDHVGMAFLEEDDLKAELLGKDEDEENEISLSAKLFNCIIRP